MSLCEYRSLFPLKSIKPPFNFMCKTQLFIINDAVDWLALYSCACSNKPLHLFVLKMKYKDIPNLNRKRIANI